MTKLRRLLIRACAYAARDRRPHPPYSWGWLNRLVESLIWTNRGAEIRPQYAWGTVMAAAQARALGLPAVRVIEFGVAGGRGLIALQTIAPAVAAALGVRIAVVGFDGGDGLRRPTDPRDFPNLYGGGEFRMDVDALRQKLDPAITTLHLGQIRDTIARLYDGGPPAGFLSIDVDLYSSSVDTLTLLSGSQIAATCLPRPVIYLDDSMGYTFGDLTGERLAVAEYNTAHRPQRGISPIYGLRYHLGWPHNRAQWPEMLYLAHLLDHPLYGRPDGLAGGTQAPL